MGLAALSDRHIASALGLVRSDADVTAGGLLQFGKSYALRRFLPTHEAAFQALREEKLEVNDFLPYPLLRSPGKRRCSPAWLWPNVLGGWCFSRLAVRRVR